MFSAIKRLAQKNEANQAKPQSHQAMSSTLQKKFSRGIQYNMKIIIKGDRNVGKTCLFHRLQGNKFIEEYIPTDEIQVTSIQWSYSGMEDVVKVEVWDIVDKGKKKKQFNGLKLENSNIDIPEETALDAEFLDVYKGTNGVILMMDITKTWTFDYVQRELPKIPPHIPVIVLANHCDMSHHRTVTPEHISYFIESMASERMSQVCFCESSMRNGFGLKILHKFFNLPFLQLQKESLLVQLKKNETETRNTISELDAYIESDEANYDKFLEKLTNKRREIAELNTNVQPRPDITISAQHTPQEIKGGSPLVKKSLPTVNAMIKSPTNVNTNINTSANFGGSMKSPSSSSLKQQQQQQQQINMQKEAKNQMHNIEKGIDVDEFCPDGGQIDKNFLDEDMNINYNNQKSFDKGEDDDNEVDGGNPLVATFQDYQDSDDEFKLAKRKGCLEPLPINANNKINSSIDNGNENEEQSKTDEADTEAGFYPTKWRTSPEGGEDPDLNDYNDYTVNKITNNKVVYSSLSDNEEQEQEHEHEELQKRNSGEYSIQESNSFSSSRDVRGSSEEKETRDKDKKKSKDRDKKHKSKKSKDKSKDKEKKERRHKSEKYHNELEDFLNGTNEPKTQVAYEAI